MYLVAVWNHQEVRGATPEEASKIFISLGIPKWQREREDDTDGRYLVELPASLEKQIVNADKGYSKKFGIFEFAADKP